MSLYQRDDERKVDRGAAEEHAHAVWAGRIHLPHGRVQVARPGPRPEGPDLRRRHGGAIAAAVEPDFVETRAVTPRFDCSSAAAVGRGDAPCGERRRKASACLDDGEALYRAGLARAGTTRECRRVESVE